MGASSNRSKTPAPIGSHAPRGSAPYEAQHGFAASRTVSRNASDAMPSRLPPARVLQSRQYRHRECDAGMYAVTCHGYVRASLLAACCQ